MALIKCPECGQQVSTAAKACTTEKEPVIFLGPLLLFPGFQGTAQPYPQTISGSFTTNGFDLFDPSVPTTITFTWNLWRHRAPP